MPFPEFEPGKKRLLFFSRGRGRGHAMADVGIFRALEALRTDIDTRFVSYGTGGEALRSSGVSFVDLGLPDAGGVVDTSVLAGKLVGWLQPDLVVSHEEFPAIPAAKIFDRPTLALTDWFLESEGYAMNALKFADQILFLGQAGVFPEPPWLSHKIHYLGAMIRDFEYGPNDCLRARGQLGISAAATVLAVFPGSWPEAQTPLIPAVLAAFDRLPGEKHLIWLAGADYEIVRAAAAGRTDATVLAECDAIDRLMVAADVAITKSNRKAVFELQHLRVPTIAVTFGLNPGDDLAVAALPNVIRLSGDGLHGAALSGAIAEARSRPHSGANLKFCSARACAERISQILP